MLKIYFKYIAFIVILLALVTYPLLNITKNLGDCHFGACVCLSFC